MSLIVGLITAACNPGTTAESATLGGSGGASESSSGTLSAGDALPTSGMSASDSQAPDGSASNSESDSNVTENNPESDSASASVSASASDSATASDSGTTGSVGDTAAGSSDSASTSGASTAGGTDPSAGPSGGEGSASDTDGFTCDVRICDADGEVHACGDCHDNDGDDQIDCTDPDCFGPCDDSEDVLGSHLEDKDPCKQDCYFDGNGGQGGGDCQWNMKCDPLEPGGPVCPYNGWEGPELDKCVDGVPSDCTNNCAPPKGCDCFGCCTIDGIDRFIGSPGCTLADPANTCNECTKQEDWCNNPCNPGDLCFPDIEPSSC